LGRERANCGGLSMLGGVVIRHAPLLLQIADRHDHVTSA
jgi:hypothetical protein